MTELDPQQAAAINAEAAALITRDLATARATVEDAPRAIADAVEDYSSAIVEIRNVAEQAAQDAAELQQKRDLFAPHGWDRLRAEARQQAESLAADSGKRAENQLAAIRQAAVEHVIPKPPSDPAAVSLARDELRTALEGVSGLDAVERALSVAQTSPEAAGVLLRTSFGRTILGSRGVEARDIDAALADARTLLAHNAAEADPKVRALLDVADKLAPVRSMALATVRDTLAST